MSSKPSLALFRNRAELNNFLEWSGVDDEENMLDMDFEDFIVSYDRWKKDMAEQRKKNV